MNAAHGKGRSRRRPITPDDLRVAGEKTALAVSLTGLALGCAVLVGLSLGAFAIALGIAAVAVKLKQARLRARCRRVTAKRLRRVHRCAKRAAARLDMEPPEVLVLGEMSSEAFAIGLLGPPSVVLHLGLVKALDDRELTAILAHEMAHIKCGHTSWLVISGTARSLRVPLLSAAARAVLLGWSRRTELTADRAAVLGAGGFRPACSALAKAIFGLEVYRRAGLGAIVRDAADSDDLTVRIGEVLSTHPRFVRRVAAMRRFYHSRSYRRLSRRGRSGDGTA